MGTNAAGQNNTAELEAGSGRQPRRLRRDARDSIAKIHAAALEIFLSEGLDASLNEIARAAGVSVGTLYNRFGSREAIIDAVIPDVVGSKLQELGANVLAEPEARTRLEAFVAGMIGLQRDDPALNDAILRRFPDATALLMVCDQWASLGSDLVRQAHADGSLSRDFTDADLFNLLWLAGTAAREPDAPSGWIKILDRALTSAWASAPPPTP